MHVVAAFLIVAALFGGFYKEHRPSKNEILFSAGNNEKQIRLRIDVSPWTEMQFHNVFKQNYDYSCGSAALASLLNYSLCENLSEKQVIHGLLKYGDVEQIVRLRAFSFYDMQRFCRALGYEAQGYRAKLTELENPEFWPCIVPITLYGYKHFVVFKGIYGGHVFVADPFRGNSSYTSSQFENMWQDKIMFLVSAGPSRKNDCERMRLSVKDLQYIREDTARDILLHGIEPYRLPPQFEMNDIPGEWQYSRPPNY